ncbi:MAG: hypothetical protein LBG27_03935 [Spirochaetaceae bacterium]|nr:hypothetical protein [Spirochaetaceae bacterium]
MALLAFTIVISGCGNGNSGGGDDNTGAKSIKISGISSDDEGKTVSITLWSMFEEEESEPDLTGSGTVSGSSVTAALLKTDDDSAWTGSGNYYIMLGIGVGEGESGGTYFYAGDGSDPVKYSITAATSTITLSQFSEMEF